jgi:hypothetical protein
LGLKVVDDAARRLVAREVIEEFCLLREGLF